MRWRTIDEVNRLKIDDKGLKATPGGGPRALLGSPLSPNRLIFGQHGHEHKWSNVVRPFMVVQGWLHPRGRRMILQIANMVME